MARFGLWTLKRCNTVIASIGSSPSQTTFRRSDLTPGCGAHGHDVLHPVNPQCRPGPQVERPCVRAETQSHAINFSHIVSFRRTFSRNIWFSSTIGRWFGSTGNRRIKLVPLVSWL